MDRSLLARLAIAVALAVILPNGTRAQLLNGSFEDSMGNFDLSHWQYTCPGASPFLSAGAPGYGNWSVLVPHSSPLSCGNSKLYQTIPGIQDGVVYTLSGWCCNWLWMVVDPYIGFLMGTKDAFGGFDYYIGPVMNTGVWTYLSVTDTFHIATGDTAFVMCDPGVVSGGSGNLTYGDFDGIELTPVITTNIAAPAASPIPYRYDPASQSLVVHVGGSRLRDIALFDATGRSQPLHATREGTSLILDLSGQVEGVYLLRFTGQEGGHVIRFAKG